MYTVHDKFQSIKAIVFIALFLIKDGGSQTMMIARNETHIKCVTKDMEKPIFLDPPVHFTNSPEPAEYELSSHDWKRMNSFNSVFGGTITDTRWEDFEIDDRNYMEIPLNPETKISFSVYNKLENIIYFYFDNTFVAEDHQINNSKIGTWDHYTLEVKNNITTFYQNSEQIKKIENFTTKLFVFKSVLPTPIKIHNATIFYSDVVFEEPLKIHVNGVLNLYSFLCSKCYLIVSNIKNDKEKLIIQGGEKWRKNKLKGNNTIYEIYKKTYDDYEHSFWVLDPRHRKEIHVFPRTNTNDTCLTLKDKEEKENEYETQIYHCNFTGLEESTCQFECRNCVCESYFKGKFCEQDCKMLECGLNCSELCNTKDATVSVSAKKYTRQKEVIGPAIALVVVSSVMVIMLLYIFKDKLPNCFNDAVQSNGRRSNEDQSNLPESGQAIQHSNQNENPVSPNLDN